MKSPMAFLSYVNADDERESGRLSKLREMLSHEVGMYVEAFQIFQDRVDLKWGQNWQQRIDNSLDSATLLIPVVTPAFFGSEACRDELARFLEREQALGRSDLVLPLYYISTSILDDSSERAQDPLAQAIHAHQYADWRELRLKALKSASVRRKIAELATHIVAALNRTVKEQQPTPVIIDKAVRAQTDIPEHKAQVRPGESIEVTSAWPAAETELRTLVVDRDAGGALMKALSHTEPSVRKAAVLALGKTKSVASEVVSALVRALHDPDENVQAAAASALGLIGPAASEAIPALVAALHHTGGAVRTSAASALGKLHATDALVKALGHIEPSVREAAASALGDVRPAASEVVSALAAALGDSYGTVREAAASALVNIGPSAVPTLAQALGAPGAAVGENAASCLGLIGPAADEAIPSLVAALHGTGGSVRKSAVWALGKLRANDALVTALDHSEPSVREAAVSALGNIRPAGAKALAALAAALRDPDGTVREAAALTLAKTGSAGISQLAGALGDPDRAVRDIVASALGKRGADALPLLEQAICDERNDVRGSAARALALVARSEPRAVPVLVKLLRENRNPTDWEAKWAAAFALRHRKDVEPGVRELAERWVESSI